jgi:hypothetical protein
LGIGRPGDAFRLTGRCALRASPLRSPAPIANPTGGSSVLTPPRSVVVVLTTYVVLALVATVALGDLGDVGFWVVWIPVLLIIVYLGAAGAARLVGRRPNGRTA